MVSGESLSQSYGKIMKLISDLKSLAYSDKVDVSNLDSTLTTAYNNRVTSDKVTTSTTITSAGYIADARSINNLQNQINVMNKNTNNDLIYKYITSPDTLLDVVRRTTKSERYFSVISWLPSDLPEQSEFFIDIMVDQSIVRKNIIAWDYVSVRMYKRQFFNGEWLTGWQKMLQTDIYDIFIQDLIHNKHRYIY